MPGSARCSLALCLFKNIEMHICVLCIGIFRLFPYTALVLLFCFQVTSHSFSPRNVMFGLKGLCANVEMRYFWCIYFCCSWKFNFKALNGSFFTLVVVVLLFFCVIFEIQLQLFFYISIVIRTIKIKWSLRVIDIHFRSKRQIVARIVIFR